MAVGDATIAWAIVVLMTYLIIYNKGKNSNYWAGSLFVIEGLTYVYIDPSSVFVWLMVIIGFIVFFRKPISM